MTRLIGKNISVLGLTRLISGVVLFFVYIRLVKYLGPAEYGKFSLVLAYYVIFQLIMDLGISRYVTKKISEDKASASLYLGVYLIVQFILSLLVFASFFVIPRALGYEPSVVQAMLLVGGGLMIAAWSLPFLSVLHAWQRIDIAAWVIFFCSMLNAGWLLLAVWLKKDIVFIFWVYLVIGFIYLVSYIWATKKFVPTSFVPRSGVVKELLRFGIPFVLIAGLEVAVQKIDVVIQKFFIPFSEIGLYSAAYRFLDFLTFVPAIVYLALFPYVAEKFSLLDLEAETVLNRLNRYLLVLAIPLGIGTTFYADKIVFSLFGARFAGTIIPLKILIWASVVTFLYAVPNVIMVVKKTPAALKILGVVAALNIILNLVFIPRFGILASAWITLLSYMLIAAGYFHFARRLCNFKLFRYAWGPLAAALLMAVVLWPFRDLNIFIWAALGGAVYAASLIGLRFFKAEDWEFIKSIYKM